MVTYYLFALLAAIFWGAGFIGSRFGLEALSPMWVTFFRFLIALMATMPFLLSMKKTKLRMELVLGAFVCGGILTTMIFLQIKGLQLTTVAKSGFITILYAFFTPVLCKLLYGSRLSSFYWLMLSVALVGMGLICELSLGTFNQGDALTLICAFFSALHILAISHFTKEIGNMMLFNILQLFAVCLLSLPVAMYLDGTDAINANSFFTNNSAVFGLIFMGIFSTSVAFFMQMKAQEKIPPHQASLIFLMESPCAAVLGYIAFGETLSIMSIFGMILVTLTVAVLPFEFHIQRVLNLINIRRAVLVRLSALLSIK